MFPERLRTLLPPATAADSEGLLRDLFAYTQGGLLAFANSERPLEKSADPNRGEPA